MSSRARIVLVAIGSVIAVLVGPIASQTATATDTTYTAYWNGIPFTEHTNPLLRFTAFPVHDAGNGFANITPVSTFSGSQATIGLTGVTNTMIQAQMLLFGIQAADVTAQIDMLLGSNPAYNAKRIDADNKVAVGNFLAVQSVVAGTPAEAKFYCGPASGGSLPGEQAWYIGVPAILDCNFDGTKDFAAVLAVTAVRLNGASVAGADLSFQTKQINAGYTDWSWFGFAYGGAALGTIAAPQVTPKMTVGMDGVGSNDVDSRVAWATGFGSYSAGDQFWVSTGYPGWRLDNTFYLVTAFATTTYNAEADAYVNTCGGRGARSRDYSLWRWIFPQTEMPS